MRNVRNELYAYCNVRFTHQKGPYFRVNPICKIKAKILAALHSQKMNPFTFKGLDTLGTFSGFFLFFFLQERQLYNFLFAFLICQTPSEKILL